MEHWPGSPTPLGATYDGTGTNFSVFSEAADGVELCLFDADGEEARVELREVDGHVWHAFLPGVGAGTRYGFRVHGPWDPAHGARCNPAKLLLDPYARAISGGIDWDEACFGHLWADPDTRNDTDSAPHVPRSVVHLPFFDWGDDRPPRTPMHRSVIYELHVKGFTQRHPEVPVEQRGTYLGLTHPAVIDHLLSLGVTAVELQPVHELVHDAHLVERGLRNYWGYNSIGFFAPHHEYSSSGDDGAQVQEFKQMVRTLHEAGIEVILDVVYNHTAEGNERGPTLSFKGLDNGAYYRLAEDPRYYHDVTGTGNTLNMRHPHTLQLVMDSLRYWVTDMHVDGFRFDLASALARGLHEVDRLSAFFDLIQQDPVISQVKLIAEPWDVGEGGYQVGNFPPLWSEWNGRYRDTVRDFWRGQEQTVGDFASRVAGSSDLYQSDSRHPVASVNFVTAHDGFTLADLVSYDERRNDANGEENRDGEAHNRSWNCGVEGPTDDEAVLALRRRQQRNLLATLLLSQGVPMVLAGDEMGRSQQGNNNAYCQDNEISWLDWDLADHGADLLAFTRRLASLRAEHPVFRRRRWFSGRAIRGAEVHDIAWFRPDGEQMTDDDWTAAFARSIGMYTDGRHTLWPDDHGRPVTDGRYFVVFNASDEAIPWVLPGPPWADAWEVVLDTSVDDPFAAAGPVADGKVEIPDRSVVVLVAPDDEGG